ncbi:unnamed protein product [Brassica oleracea]
MITQSALKEKDIYGRFKFRAYASDPANYPGFPVFWINEGECLYTFFFNLLLLFMYLLIFFKRAIRLLNSRSTFNVLLAHLPLLQNAASSSGELIDKEWLCFRLSVGETLMNEHVWHRENF